MKRREFVAATALAGLAPLGRLAAGQNSTEDAARDIYELRTYHLDTAEQRAGLDAFLKDAALPALNRIGIDPVGVFCPEEGFGPVYVLLRHPSLQSVVTLVARLGEDEQFLEQGAAFLDAPASAPAYARMETSLMVAFQNMPHLERPIDAPGRVFQLRIYESPSVKTGQKKIEMFNDGGEIAIFRSTGLHPVFFGETIIGSKMPNLTYMLSFHSKDELKANWKQFVSSPEWKQLSSKPEYADKAILCGITNILLQPTEYSQL
jgi:hypothetical protein